MRRPLIALIAILLCGTPAWAQEDREKDVQGFFVLWGMMDRTANFCWETADRNPAYKEAGENWKARNLPVRSEMDEVLAALGGPTVAVADIEAIGAARMDEALRGHADPRAFCAELMGGINAGTFDGEVYLAEQLGRLRERDGM